MDVGDAWELERLPLPILMLKSHITSPGLSFLTREMRTAVQPSQLDVMIKWGNISNAEDNAWHTAVLTRNYQFQNHPMSGGPYVHDTHTEFWVSLRQGRNQEFSIWKGSAQYDILRADYIEDAVWSECVKPVSRACKCFALGPHVVPDSHLHRTKNRHPPQPSSEIPGSSHWGPLRSSWASRMPWGVQGWGRGCYGPQQSKPVFPFCTLKVSADNSTSSLAISIHRAPVLFLRLWHLFAKTDTTRSTCWTEDPAIHNHRKVTIDRRQVPRRTPTGIDPEIAPPSPGQLLSGICDSEAL